jgi:poly(3-hydroxybutyrate) depolymerase
MSQKIPFVNSPICQGLLVVCFALGLGCSSGSDTGTGGATSAGGKSAGGSSATGGSTSAGGSSGSGGKTSAGGSTTAGTTGAGGATSAGGASGLGGSTATGGNGQTGGVTSAGGSAATGGSTKTGGTGAGGSTNGGSGIDAGGGGSSGDVKPSAGCGKAPATLKSATVGQATPVNTISVGGANREFLVRWPSNYKNDQPYRLHMGLHGYGGNLSENGRDNFGLWSLSKDTTIFVTLAAVSGAWNGPADLLYADAVLKQVESELCIDTSRVMLEGFSMGGAMSWYLTGSRPGVFRAVVGHSGGGVQGIPTLSPVAYLGSLGTQEGNGQNTQTDQFAKANGCTIDTLPRAPTGSHVCTPYKGCKDGFPVTWCSYDGGHGFQPTDAGSSKTWMPQAVWDFLSPL